MNTERSRRYRLEFRIISENGQQFRLAVYVNGEYGGTCRGYRTARCHDRIEIYPERIMPTYARIAELDFRTYRLINEMRWA